MDTNPALSVSELQGFVCSIQVALDRGGLSLDSQQHLPHLEPWLIMDLIHGLAG